MRHAFYGRRARHGKGWSHQPITATAQGNEDSDEDEDSSPQNVPEFVPLPPKHYAQILDLWLEVSVRVHCLSICPMSDRPFRGGVYSQCFDWLERFVLSMSGKRLSCTHPASRGFLEVSFCSYLAFTVNGGDQTMDMSVSCPYQTCLAQFQRAQRDVGLWWPVRNPILESGVFSPTVVAGHVAGFLSVLCHIGFTVEMLSLRILCKSPLCRFRIGTMNVPNSSRHPPISIGSACDRYRHCRAPRYKFYHETYS